MKNRFIAGTIAIGLTNVILAANLPPQPARQLLDKLRAQRQLVLNSASNVPTTLPKRDLKPMIGLTRETVAEGLGKPDFCAPSQGDRGCSRSAHWAYFFFQDRPPSARVLANGYTAVSVTAGGGWAIEMDFSQDVVTHAYWKSQE